MNPKFFSVRSTLFSIDNTGALAPSNCKPRGSRLYARVGRCGDSCRLDESSRLEYGATSWKIEKPFLDFNFKL